MDSYAFNFTGLGVIEFTICSELVPSNCGVKGLTYIKCTPGLGSPGTLEYNKNIETLCKEFYNYIINGISSYPIVWMRGSDPFWDPYDNISTRAIYILTGAVNDDETPYLHPIYQTVLFCYLNKLPHFEMMQNPFHKERKSAVYGLCVGFKKRGKKETI